MQTALTIVVLSVLCGVIWKLRADAAKERKAVMARLAVEKEERGEYSPLAEVFREAGVPLERIDALEQLGPAATGPTSTIPAPTSPAASGVGAEATSASVERPGTVIEADLRDVLAGIRLPAGLALFGPSTPMRVVLASEAPMAVVRAGLEEELERIGCRIRWAEPQVLDVARDGHLARFTFHSEAASATDAQGRPLFAGIDAVRLAVVAEMV